MNDLPLSSRDSSSESQPDSLPVLSLVSLVHALLGVFGWLTFFIFAGVLGMNHERSREMNTVIGLVAMAGLAVNLAMMICGLIGVFRTKHKALSFAAALLNGLEIAAIIAVIMYGVSVAKHNRAQRFRGADRQNGRVLYAPSNWRKT